MRIESIHIDGFGCLHARDFTLRPGLNLFCGPNEAGKSTLQEAIWALLYGFFRSDRRNAKESEQLDRFRPWSGAEYRGKLIYRLDDGRCFEVYRTFDAAGLETTIIDKDTGRNLTNTFQRGRLGRVMFAVNHFGMSEEVFVNTCFVRQADLHRLADAAHAITETIVNLSGTGSQDRSVKKAQQLLDSALRTQVGSPRSQKAPLPQAHSQLKTLNLEKNDIETQRRALEQDINLRAELRRAKENHAYALDKYDYLLAAAQAEKLEKTMEQIRELWQTAKSGRQELAELTAAETFPLEDRDTIIGLYNRWQSASERWQRLAGQVKAHSAEVEPLQGRRQDVAQQSRALEAARTVPLEREKDLRQLEQQWRDALKAVALRQESIEQRHASLAPVGETKPFDADSLPQLKTMNAPDEPPLLAHHAPQSPFRRLLLLGGVAATFIGVACLLLGLIRTLPLLSTIGVFLSLFGVSAIVVTLARAYQSRGTNHSAKTNGAPAAVMEEMEATYLRSLMTERQEESRRLQELLEQEKERLHAAESDLRVALNEMPLQESGDLALALEQFYDLCENRRSLEKLEAELNALDARLDGYAGQARQLQEAAIEPDVLKREFLRRMSQLGISDEEPGAALDAFHKRLSQAERARRLRHEIKTYEDQIRALQAGQALEHLKQQFKAASQKAREPLAAHPDLKGATSELSQSELEQKREESRQAKSEVEAELAGVEERIRLAGSNRRPPAEVEEELQNVQETIESLQRFGQALQLAKDHLAAAADEHHRNFLPHINRLVSHSLGHVTAGRYSDVRIDHHDFQVNIQLPEHSRLISPELLSRGAQEQVYLLLRLGLTQLMSNGRERLPLVLDDPLVNFDRVRTQRTLEFLAELGEEAQILLFTKDEDIMAWATSKIGPDNVHALAVL